MSTFKLLLFLNVVAATHSVLESLLWMHLAYKDSLAMEEFSFVGTYQLYLQIIWLLGFFGLLLLLLLLFGLNGQKRTSFAW